MVKVTLKNGDVLEVNKGISVLEIAKQISGRLAKEAMAGEVNEKVVDLGFKIEEDSTLNILKFEDNQGEHTFRHSSAHLLAMAVKRLFPDTKLAIGPAIDNGFYYDFDTEHVFSPEDLVKIEAEMKKIVNFMKY